MILDQGKQIHPKRQRFVTPLSPPQKQTREKRRKMAENTRHGNALRPRNPRKLKDTKQRLKNDCRGLSQSDSRVTQKLPFSTPLRHFWAAFESPWARKSLLSHFFVSLNFSGFVSRSLNACPYSRKYPSTRPGVLLKPSLGQKSLENKEKSVFVKPPAKSYIVWFAQSNVDFLIPGVEASIAESCTCIFVYCLRVLLFRALGRTLGIFGHVCVSPSLSFLMCLPLSPGSTKSPRQGREICKFGVPSPFNFIIGDFKICHPEFWVLHKHRIQKTSPLIGK